MRSQQPADEEKWQVQKGCILIQTKVRTYPVCFEYFRTFWGGGGGD